MPSPPEQKYPSQRKAIHWLGVCIFSVAGLAMMQPALAQVSPALSDPKHYQITAGALPQVLAQFALTADVSLSYDPLLAQEKSSPGLSGSYTVASGFAALLRGSGLVAVLQTSGGYVLQSAPLATSQAAASNSAPVVSSALPAVSVTGDAEDDAYSAARETMATGTSAPLQQIPQSVQVITHDIIRDQQAQNLFDIVHNIGGMGNNLQTYGFATDSYEVHGYSARLHLDGVAYQYMLNIPVVGIDRVEVIKGADSALVGDMLPGGVINIITKQPQREPVREITVQTGSFGNIGLATDIGGAFAADNHLLYRVVVSAEKANENFAGYKDARQFYFAPSLAWDDATTRLVAGIQYSHGRTPALPYTVAIGTRPANVPNVISNADEHTDFNQMRLYYQYSHKLNDSWSIRSTSSLSRQTATQYDYTVAPDDQSGVADYGGYMQTLRQRNFDIDNSVAGKFSTGGITHNTTLGIAYFTMNPVISGVLNQSVESNIFKPQVPFSSPQRDSESLGNVAEVSTNWRAYLQDFMAIGKRWHVVTAISLNRAQTDGKIDRAWTPKLGAAYQVSNLLTVYGNYARSFSAQTTLLENGAVAPPTTGKTVEGGIKLTWPDKPLDLMFSLFQASQNNLAQQVSGRNFSVLTPGGDSRGMEVNLQGQLTSSWKIIASYTYTDSRTAPTQVNQVPRHIASLWTTYAFQQAALRNWNVGLGVYAQSSYSGAQQLPDINDDLNTFIIPGQTRTDLSVFYRSKQFSTTLGIKNLFNRTLYAGRAVAEQIYLEPRRALMLTTTYNF